MPDSFRVIAHRGASAHAPENTLPAFERAIEMGASEVELDIRFSADEEIMVFHDDDLQRKTGHLGRVRHHTAEDLSRMDIGAWFDRTHPDSVESFQGTYLNSLKEVFEQLGSRVFYHIEIKGWEDWLPLRLLQEIDRFDLRAQVTVTSFSMRPLIQMRSLSDQVPICFLLRDAADAIHSAEFRPELEGLDLAEVYDYWIDASAVAGFDQVGIRAAGLRPRMLTRAADRSLEVRGWGVRDEADLARLIALGAVGATVDWPGRGIEIVEKWVDS